MKKIITIIGYAIVIADKFIYNTLGVVSSLRRVKWTNDARKIQQRLDYEHSERDWFNRVNGTNLYTKAVMNRIML